MPDDSLRDTATDKQLLKRSTPWQTLSARVISLVSRKGGVGKTTSAVNLGAAFALSGHTVLVVGTDPQCGVARTLGYGVEDLDGCLPEIFTEGRELTHLAQTSPLKDLYFISPGIRSLADEEAYLELMSRQADLFVSEIDRARNLYDTIIIDCPPNLNAATRAALLASDSYLVPVQAEELCRDSLEPLISFIDSFRENVFPAGDQLPDEQHSRPLDLEGMFLTMNSARTRMGKHVAARVSEDFGANLFTAAIPRTIRLSEMALRGKPAVIYDRRSPGSRAYFDLADEIMTGYSRRHGTGPQLTVRTDPDLPEDIEGFAPSDAHREAGARNPHTEEAAPAAVDALASGINGENAGTETGEDSGADRAGGLERFLADLRAAKLTADPAADQQAVPGPKALDGQDPGDSDSAAPEMVSLDDLLAEEERGAEERSDWDDERWNRGGEPFGGLN